MANATDPFAATVHGANPQNMVEKITRLRIYANDYWKEHCFGLTAETLVDKAMDLKFVGGIYSHNIKPTPFMCLTLKMLQIQPEKEIIVEFIKNEDYKYVRALGALYIRLVGKAIDIYQYLEPLYNDLRKLRMKSTNGWTMRHVDEFVEELITGTHSCDIALPRLPPRMHLEDQELLKPYRSLLEEAGVDDEEEEMDHDEPESEPEAEAKERDTSEMNEASDHDDSKVRSSATRRHSRSRSRERRSRSRSRSRDRRQRSRSGDRDRREEERERRKRERERDHSHDRERRDRGRGDRDESRRREDRRDRGRRDHRSPSRSRSNGRDHRRRSRSRSQSRSRSRDRRKTKSKRPKQVKGLKKTSADVASASSAAASKGGGKKGSVEYWDQERAKLGLKPLREKKR